ncbi:MAG: NAD(P)-dependent alcohol dehydrogenase [Bdellovibrionales bacterium]|nr:NAD(P)-dependent alcohol dehydrogenase [Bdellovibrionales bacterium]
MTNTLKFTGSVPAKGYAAQSAKTPLAPFEFTRREPHDTDVQIEVLYCGVCHSDIHQARDEWGGSTFPMVPGHEVVGKVTRVGAKVKGFKPGDLAGVGCMVDSCRDCKACGEGLEQYCENGANFTYNSKEKDGVTPTQGGYSTVIVTDEKFVLRMPKELDLAASAPLLCAGITTYSPLRHWKVGKGTKVAVVGLGGLGHMGVKLARAMGAEVTAITTSTSKKEDAIRLGAHHVVVSKNPAEMEAAAGRFDFILNTVSAPTDINAYVNLLAREGTMCLVGVPDKAPELQAFPLISGRRSVAGSLIGGIKETQEMLDFCAKHGITSDIEKIPMAKINDAYTRMIKGDVKYRFVIDCKTI